MKTVDEWKQLLRDGIRSARLARRADDVTVLQETLAAIDNAEAPPAVTERLADGVIAGSVEGVGATEVMRRALSPSEVAELVEHEIADRRTTAASYTSHGRTDEAARLLAQADVLARLL